MIARARTRLRRAFFKAAALFALLALATGSSTWARQIFQRGDSEYLIDAWETDDGLPENSATAMAQTADGYLWFGTFNGLVRFDGVKFSVLDASNTPELPSAGIVNLHLDSAGSMWVSTLLGLVVRRGGAWVRYGPEQGWTGNYVRTFSENAGVLCLTSFDGKVFRVENDRVRELPRPPGPSEGFAGNVDGAGRVWVAQQGFFGVWDGQRWVASPLTDLVTNHFNWAGQARDGSFLMLGDTSGLLRIKDGQLRGRVELPPMSPGAWRLDEDGEGNVWVSGHGLDRISPQGQVAHFSSTNGLTYDNLRFTFEDREHNIWVGASGGGLMRLKRRTVFSYGTEHGLAERNVKAVMEEAPGRMLVGTFGQGIERLEAGRFSPVPAPPGQEYSGFVQCLVRDRLDNTWIGSYRAESLGRSLIVLGNHEPPKAPPAQAGTEGVRSLFEDAQGRIWLGTYETISVFAEGQFKTTGPNENNRLAAVRGFAQNPSDGTMWAANSYGLFRLEGDAWREIKAADGASLRGLNCVRVERDGTVWIGQGGVGILRLRGRNWSSITQRNGLPARDITCFLDDNLGNWWMGSNRGIIRAKKQDLDGVADGVQAELPHQVFNISDGMASVECAPGYQSASARDSQGRLWFATLKGVAMVDPQKLHLNVEPPKVVIERVAYTDRSGAAREVLWPAGRQVVVPAGSRELAIYYAGLNYAAPEKMRFAYRADEPGARWVDVQGRRNISFPQLRPGALNLRVKAANNDGVWNETGAALALLVQPFYWQTLWFRGLAFLVAGGGIGLSAWRLTLNRIERRLEVLEAQRNLMVERSRLAAIVESSDDAIIGQSTDGIVTSWNHGAERIFGYAATEVIGGQIGTIFPANQLDDEAQIRRRMNTGADAIQIETVCAAKSGRLIVVAQSISAIRDAGGEILGFARICRDVTEPKRAEEALRRSEQQFSNVVNTVDGIVWEADARTLRFTFVSNQAERLLGYPIADWLGQPDFWSDHIHPGDRAGAVQFRQAVSRRGKTHDCEYRMLAADGRVVWLRDIATVTQNDGALVMLRGVMVEVTTQKQNEALLEGQKRVLEQIARGVPLNQALETLIQVVEEHSPEMLGSILLLDSEGRRLWRGAAPNLPEAYSRAIDGVAIGPNVGSCGTAAFRRERVVVSDIASDPLWASYREVALAHGLRACWSNPIIDAQGRVLGAFAGYFRAPSAPTERHFRLIDLATHTAAIAITRHHEQEALRLSEERFRQLAGAVNAVFWMTTPDKNQILYISPAYERIWGRSCATLLAAPRDWLDAIHVEDRARVLAAAATRQTTGDYDLEYRIVRPDGTQRWIHDRAFPIPDDTGRVHRIAGLATDITEQHELEEQIRQSQKMDSVGQLAGGIAHDFNNILTVIQGHAELLQGSAQIDATSRHDVRQIAESAVRAANLTRQLLAFSRRQVMKLTLIDLNQVVDNMAGLLRRIVGEHIQLEVELGPAPLWAKADKGMMEQILLNLAVNSRDAMPGGGRLTLKSFAVAVDAAYVQHHLESAPGPHVCVSVIDTGSGISPEHLPRIFEPFFTTKDVGKGTGLGLATVYGIVKQHQGWITVESELKRGATFTVFLPESTERKVSDAEASPLPARGGQENILVVEDEDSVRSMAKSILKLNGYRVLEAANGRDALNVWRAHSRTIDLLFTDMMMPGGINGRQLAEQLRAERPDLRVIYTTGYSLDLGVQDPSLREGVDFLQKPYMPQKLVQAVRQCLDAPARVARPAGK